MRRFNFIEKAVAGTNRALIGVSFIDAANLAAHASWRRFLESPNTA